MPLSWMEPEGPLFGTPGLEYQQVKVPKVRQREYVVIEDRTGLPVAVWFEGKEGTAQIQGVSREGIAIVGKDNAARVGTYLTNAPTMVGSGRTFGDIWTGIRNEQGPEVEATAKQQAATTASTVYGSGLLALIIGAVLLVVLLVIVKKGRK